MPDGKLLKESDPAKVVGTREGCVRALERNLFRMKSTMQTMESIACLERVRTGTPMSPHNSLRTQ